MNASQIASVLRDWLSVRLFDVGETSVTVASVLTFFLVVLTTLWISRVVQRVTQRLLERGGVQQEGTIATVRRLGHYLVLVAGVAVALQTIGISLTSVFAAGAVVAVAIGFALQNILQNFVSGVILLAERSITETDILEVEGEIVRIERMGARATLARTLEEEELIIPNSILVQGMVKNLTLTDPMYRVRTEVGVSYTSDMRRVEEVLTEAGRAAEYRVEDRDPRVVLLDFGDSSVVWQVSIWIADPWARIQARSSLNKAIWFGLADAGITIAYPQLDLHVVSGLSGTHAEANG